MEDIFFKNKNYRLYDQIWRDVSELLQQGKVKNFCLRMFNRESAIALASSTDEEV